MPRYLIDDENGQRMILADAAFIEENYPDAQLLDEAEYEPPPEPEPHTQKITRRQGLLAIYRQKSITEADIQAVIDQMIDESQKYEAHVEFHSAFWEIGSPVVAMFAQHLGITSDELQQLFDYAGGL